MNAPPTRRTIVAVITNPTAESHVAGVLAMLAALLIGGFLRTSMVASAPAVISDAAITKPALQPMVQFNFRPPMWGMPEATTWTHMDFSIVEVAPGKSFDTSAGWFTSTDGPFLIAALSGKLDIDPNGPAIVYPADHTRQPQQLDAAASALLGPNDAIAFSAADAAVGTNPGTKPLLALFGLAGSEDFSAPGAFTSPRDFSQVDFEYIDGMPVLPTARATVSIQRVELQPYDSFVFDPAAIPHSLPALDPLHTQGLQMAAGELGEWSPAIDTIPLRSSTSWMYPQLGKHTLFALGDHPVEISFFVVAPYPASATPTP